MRSLCLGTLDKVEVSMAHQFDVIVEKDPTNHGCRVTTQPALIGKELVAVLGKAGFEVIRVRGSHHL